MPPNKMERFTQRARGSLSMAQEEAEQLHHNAIGTQHLLMGLMREASGIAGVVLRDLGVDLQRTQQLVIEQTPPEMITPSSTLDLAADTKGVLELAVEEARLLGHVYIGTEHLLLAIVRQSENTALVVLKEQGISAEAVRNKVLRVLEENPVQNKQPTEPASPPSASGVPKSQPAAAVMSPTVRRPASLQVNETTPFKVIQAVITQILGMVEAKTLTSAQAAELLGALQPYLAPSTGQKAQLVAQAVGLTDLEKRQLQIVIRNSSTREVVFESSMPLPAVLDNLDTLVNVIITNHAGWFWGEDISATNRIEFRITEDEA